MTVQLASLSAGAVFAGYRIEELVARGGMGVIYRATEERPRRTVALKVVAPELAADAGFRERFLRESQIAASIEHPHVVPVSRLGEVDGVLFIAMRFIGGRDLAALIAAEGRLGHLRAATIVDQIADAIDTAHELGLVHRDVKPANVLVEQRRRGDHVYLTDFGLTKDLATNGRLTGTGIAVGTTDYMAPEQFEGGPLDARVDVYSLGCVLFEMLTGRVPYERHGQAARMYAHLTAPPPTVSDLVPGLSSRFDEIIARALAKSPDDRYPSAGDLAVAALAAAERRSVSRSERSVGSGAAAPAGRGSTVHDALVKLSSSPDREPPAAGGEAAPPLIITEPSPYRAGRTAGEDTPEVAPPEQAPGLDTLPSEAPRIEPEPIVTGDSRLANTAKTASPSGSLADHNAGASELTAEPASTTPELLEPGRQQGHPAPSLGVQGSALDSDAADRAQTTPSSEAAGEARSSAVMPETAPRRGANTDRQTGDSVPPSPAPPAPTSRIVDSVPARGPLAPSGNEALTNPRPGRRFITDKDTAGSTAIDRRETAERDTPEHVVADTQAASKAPAEEHVGVAVREQPTQGVEPEREPGAAEPPSPGAATVRRRRIAAGGALIALIAIIGVLVLVLSGGGSRKKPVVNSPAAESRSSGPLTLIFRSPWQATAADVTGAAVIGQTGASSTVRPVKLVDGVATLAAGPLLSSAAIPGGPPPALLASRGQPVSTTDTKIAGNHAKEYVWSQPGQRLEAYVLPTETGDLAIICQSSVVGHPVAPCDALVQHARVSGARLLPPGPVTSFGTALSKELQPALLARSAIGRLADPKFSTRASKAQHVAAADASAAKAIVGLSTPDRYRGQLEGLVSALRKEASAFTALARVALASKRTAYQSASSEVNRASGLLASAAATFTTAGLHLPRVPKFDLAGSPALPKAAAPASQPTYTAPTYTAPPSSGSGGSSSGGGGGGTTTTIIVN